MKKRFSLILLLGVSFVPPVFASTDLSSYRPVLSRTGEQGENEISVIGRQCQYSVVEKELQADQAGSGKGTVSGATAGSAGLN